MDESEIRERQYKRGRIKKFGTENPRDSAKCLKCGARFDYHEDYGRGILVCPEVKRKGKKGRLIRPNIMGVPV